MHRFSNCVCVLSLFLNFSERRVAPPLRNIGVAAHSSVLAQN